ncbi:MAG: ribosome biogenesis GTPase Der [Polyangia bacterium]
MPSRPPLVGERPLIAILGRPNVGKSTLFNRLVGRRAALVEDEPGVTRDRIYADADIYGRQCTLVDMGGFESSPHDDISEGVNRQCRVALEQAGLVLFVVDGRFPPTAGDQETADLLRRSGAESILVVNKIDGRRRESEAVDAFSLGIEPAVMISALHGRAVSDLMDLICERLPEAEEESVSEQLDEEAEAEENETRVAVIGRPNVGKSSLVNRVLGEERLLILDRPGTTRDAVDVTVQRDDSRYVLVDTAGMRRKRSISRAGPERLAVSAAVRAVERCHVAVLLTDAEAGTSEQDARLLGLALDRGRAAVVAINKWDLLAGDEERRRAVARETRERFSFAPWAPLVRVSALTGRGLNRLFDEISSCREQFGKRVRTSELNRLFDDIVEHHPPPLRKGRPVKLYYATQASVRPPTFVVQCSYPEALHFSYRRYVENRIRETFGFAGTPIRLVLRKRSRRG